MDDSSALAELVRTRKRTDSRREFLVDSVRFLSSSEVRELKDVLNNVDLRFDILGELPLELGLEIAKHLPLNQIFRSQIVSRRWADILSSSTVLRRLLHVWTSGQEINFPENLFARIHHVSTIAERIEAYKIGSPFSISLKPIPNLHHCGYADGVFAWTDRHDMSFIGMHNLKNGVEFLLMTPNREHVAGLAIGPEMIAASTRAAKVYVWRVPTEHRPKSRLIRLESASQIVMGNAKNTLALFQKNVDPAEPIITTTIYHIEDDSVRSFQRKYVEACRYSPDQMLYADGLSLLYVDGIETREADADCARLLSATRCNLEGEVIASWSFECICSYALPGQIYTPNLALIATQPLVRACLQPIPSMMNQRRDLQDLSKSVLQRIFLHDAGNAFVYDSKKMEMPGVYRTGLGLYTYNKCCYFNASHHHPTEFNGLRVANLEEETNGIAVIEHALRDYLDHDDLDSLDRCDADLMGDETFIVTCIEETLLVMCFDKSVKLPDELQQYRRERREKYSKFKELDIALR